MFTAALATRARIRKQSKSPSADEWIRKLWNIQPMEFYSAIISGTFELVLMRWMNLEPIIQSEVSQKEKDKYCVLTHISMESRKMLVTILCARQQRRHRHKEMTFGHSGRRRGWDASRE